MTNDNGEANTNEQLLYRLCSKIANDTNVSLTHVDAFVNSSFSYIIRLLSSQAYTTVHNQFEIGQKIKKRLINANRVEDASKFNELEAKYLKLKFLENPAALLQFFLVYLQNKPNDSSGKNALNGSSYDVAQITSHANHRLVENHSSAQRLTQLFANTNIKSAETPVKAKPIKASGNNLQEGFLLRELIYALQGVEGVLFQRDAKDQTMCIRSEKEHLMERSVKMTVLRFLEFGWLYLRLRDFINSLNRSSIGLVPQAFSAYISCELKEYHRLVAVLESQLTRKDDGIFECGNLTLRRLMVWLEQPMERLKYLNVMCDAVRNRKGGLFLSTLYSYSEHGDPFKSTLVKAALTKCITPIRDMIIEWIFDGQIRDSHEEFFVGCDKTVSNDRLWREKYFPIKEQIPSFLNQKQADKILVIGKSINFLRVVCDEHTQLKLPQKIPSLESILNEQETNEFQDIIDTTYTQTNNYLIEILMKKYRLADHFNALKRYLLLGQGDFIRHLMDLMETELNKNAEDLVYHNLKSLLNKAVTESNAQFDPNDIISRLDIRILIVSPGDKGWDVFSLDYKMDGPLRTIFTTQCVERYLHVFNFLWRVKRMEYILCSMWSLQKGDMEKFRTMPNIYKILHQGNIISSEMLRLIQNINHYIMFEVLEVSWEELLQNLKTARDMDDVINANEKFLNNISSSLFFDENKNSEHIRTELRSIFNLIVEITNLNQTFYHIAINEYETRKLYMERMKTINKNEFDENIELAEQERYKNEVKQKVKSTRNQLSIYKNSLNTMVRKLLEMLKSHHYESLRFLSLGFNFNEYYNC